MQLSIKKFLKNNNDESIKKSISSSNSPIRDIISTNDDNNLNNTNITIYSKIDVLVIVIVDSSSRQFLEISEQLRNVRAVHHSRYMKNKTKG